MEPKKNIISAFFEKKNTGAVSSKLTTNGLIWRREKKGGVSGSKNVNSAMVEVFSATD